jgi:hypothetical protein
MWITAVPFSGVVDRHLQIAQSADDPRRPDLIGPAAAIAAGRIDVGQLDQPHLVVMPQRLMLRYVARENLPILRLAVMSDNVRSPPGGESRC